MPDVPRGIYKVTWAQSFQAVQYQVLTLHILPIVICHGRLVQVKSRASIVDCVLTLNPNHEFLEICPRPQASISDLGLKNSRQDRIC